MVAHSFCGVAPPNLATLLVLDKFRNPVRQPVVKSIRGEFPQVYAAFKGGRCEAAVVRTNFYVKKISDAEKQNLKIIFQSAHLPNQGFSVSKRVGARERELLKQALTTNPPDKTVAELISRFGKSGDRMILTNNAEFSGYNNLLEGVIYGWE